MKINHLLLSKLFLLVAILLHVQYSSAVQVVRLQLEYGGDDTPAGGFDIPKTIKTVDLELFDDVAPNTVTNFLNYLADGRFDEMFISRSVPGFVLQTGGYTFKPSDPENDFLAPAFLNVGVAEPIPKDPAIGNEFNLSNVRGTIAMALAGGDPDSATSEWFINLVDNSASLDAQSFTVFGELIDDGMVLAEEIENFPIFAESTAALGSAVAAIPAADYDPVAGGNVYLRNLVMITSASVISRPIIRFTPASGDMGINIAGGLNVVPVEVKNTGNEALDITAVNIAGISAPFSVQSQNCSSATLDPISVAPSSSCNITFQFSPTAEGLFTDSISIDYTSNITGDTYTVTYNIFGEGVPNSPILSVSVNAVSFGNVSQPGDSVTEDLQIQNRGGGSLLLNALDVAGANSDQFSRESTGCAVGGSLLLGETCDVSLTYTPTFRGFAIANLTIDSNGGPIKVITLDGQHIPPQISVATTSAEIGYAEIGETILFQILATNDGLGGLVIENISFTGPDAADFSRGADSCPDSASGEVIQNGESCGMIIEFSPASTGIKTATMVVESNDPDNPVINIDLTAGRQPSISVSSSVDVGVAQVGQTIEFLLEVTNTAGPGLSIDNLSFSGADAALFSQLNDCPDLTPNRPRLVADESCLVLLSFTPDSEGSKTATLAIESNDPSNPVVFVTLTGGVDNAVIQVPSSFDVISQVDGISTKRDLIVTNTGGAPLDITSVTGLGVSGFTQNNNCVANNILAGRTCAITITYATSSFSQSSAILTIESNDLVNPSVDVVINGFGQTDSDGVSDVIEAASPGTGDGNNDDIQDEIQNDVASFVGVDSRYITIVSDKALTASTFLADASTALGSVQLVTTIPDGPPSGAKLDFGLYNFDVNLPVGITGDSVDVAIYLPADAAPTRFFRYGPTPDNPVPHWYNFAFDSSSQTGAFLIGRVSIPSPSGKQVEKNMVVLRLVDGRKGDDDLQVNGKISHGVGGVSTQKDPSTETSSGSAVYMWLSIMLFVFRIYGRQRLIYIKVR